MNEIIPLVSFPKSGNTWMRFILSNLFKDDKDFEINFKTINDISPTAYNQNHTKMKSLLKDNAPLFIKEHYSYDDMPYTDFKKAVYIYRNGFDTLLSYWHFRNAQSPGKYFNLEHFSKYYWNGFRHWGDHIYSWLDDENTNKKHDIFAISYEELMKNPVEVISDCLTFLDYDIPKDEIEKAVILSGKDKMKKMSGSAEFMKSKDKNFHFVRSGNKSEGNKELSNSSKTTFMKHKLNYTQMIKYHYIDDDNEWNNIEKYLKNPLKTSIVNKYINIRHRFFISND